MGKRGRPKKEVDVVQEEVKVEKPITEPKEKVQEEIKEPVEPIQENDDFDLSKENEFLVAGFKVSKHYNKDLEGKELKKAFEKFKGE